MPLNAVTGASLDDNVEMSHSPTLVDFMMITRREERALRPSQGLARHGLVISSSPATGTSLLQENNFEDAAEQQSQQWTRIIGGAHTKLSCAVNCILNLSGLVLHIKLHI